MGCCNIQTKSKLRTNMKQLKQLPFLKLGVTTLLHSATQFLQDYLYEPGTKDSPGSSEVERTIKELNLNDDELGQSTGKLIQSICGDVGGNIAATSAVTALKIFGISEKAKLLTKGLISEKTLGAVAGAASDALVSCAIKLNFTNLFQLVEAGVIGASNGYNTAALLEDIEFDSSNKIGLIDQDVLNQQDADGSVNIDYQQ